MGKVEVLAPAGDMECFKAAIAAGADAVYMSGKAFGARASATNFTEEEFIWALNHAHIHGRKIYLTLNTLIKEKEWDDIYDFVLPLYNAGLDGIIIQDLGLVDYLHEAFPSLELHASTQMTITDAGSASILKEHGICRVVPARELSLKEIKLLKEKTGLSIETFVHGALCYCYSGQCLFSSYLGGRSGNRGRCAGPCRLPYVVNKKEEYPLSLKDLCTVSHIADLIEAGIDSFKIEGRMKSREYVAGVTAIYRKYVDRYYAGMDTKVSKEDLHTLESLYLRSSIGSGYYYKHNGEDMITLSDPSYNNKDQSVVNRVKDTIIDQAVSKSVNASVYIHTGDEMSMTVYDDEGHAVTVTGDIVSEASKQPAGYDNIIEKISKTGGTEFKFDSVMLELGDNCFVPVSQINELRRQALSEMYDLLISDYLRTDARNKPDRVKKAKEAKRGLSVSIMLAKQLDVVKDYAVDRIFVPYDLLYSNQVTSASLKDIKATNKTVKIYLSLPRIKRLRDDEYYKSLKSYILGDNNIDGILVSNLEQIYELSSCDMKDWDTRYETLHIMSDSTLYGWNDNSLDFIYEYVEEVTAPLELSLYELRDTKDTSMCLPVYGYASLMVSANCIAKTYGGCTGMRYGFDYNLTDRYKKSERVFCNCLHCYNEIFNALPTSLHKKLDAIKKAGFENLRINLTSEDEREARRVLEYYLDIGNHNGPVDEYTTGHIDKGAL